MQQTIILVESHEPEMQVTLPVGTHVLELVVQDSGGEESPPVTIVVIVEPDTGKEPIIDDFAPSGSVWDSKPILLSSKVGASVKRRQIKSLGRKRRWNSRMRTTIKSIQTSRPRSSPKAPPRDWSWSSKSARMGRQAIAAFGSINLPE